MNVFQFFPMFAKLERIGELPFMSLSSEYFV